MFEIILCTTLFRHTNCYTIFFLVHIFMCLNTLIWVLIYYVEHKIAFNLVVSIHNPPYLLPSFPTFIIFPSHPHCKPPLANLSHASFDYGFLMKFSRFADFPLREAVVRLVTPSPSPLWPGSNPQVSPFCSWPTPWTDHCESPFLEPPSIRITAFSRSLNDLGRHKYIQCKQATLLLPFTVLKQMKRKCCQHNESIFFCRSWYSLTCVAVINIWYFDNSRMHLKCTTFRERMAMIYVNSYYPIIICWLYSTRLSN